MKCNDCIHSKVCWLKTQIDTGNLMIQSVCNCSNYLSNKDIKVMTENILTAMGLLQEYIDFKFSI